MVYLLTNKAQPVQIQGMLEEYGSMMKLAIDIRPVLGNRGMLIQSQEIRNAVEAITRNLLGTVQ